MAQLSDNQKYEQYIVGDDNCEYKDICDILTNSASSGVLWPKLIDLARSLKVSDQIVARLKTSLLIGTVTYSDALYDILVAWRGSEARAATLHRLTCILEGNGLKDCAVTLRNRFDAR